ncbi:FCP1 homology domain-containing protein [Trichonephila clavata]|uniref:FCP1 homology domain-containing protein n=1 Tax=Trichonephila clavata TaxID=2740835 RepID=A0A8X6F7A6_TRICU|nr:FCP1 homology domain-containing protein [Trichonephila clavata]
MESGDYVHRVVNGFLPELIQHLFKLFARSDCNYSKTYYQYTKASAHIRDMYSEPIFLIAVDDKVSENMDEQYDLRIYVPPYTKYPSPTLQKWPLLTSDDSTTPTISCQETKDCDAHHICLDQTCLPQLLRGEECDPLTEE